MDSVNASIASRCRQLSEKQREFVHAIANASKSAGFSQLRRSQITMNSVLLCQGSISRLLFLSFAENRADFAEILRDYQDVLKCEHERSPSVKQLEKWRFSLRMQDAKLKKRIGSSGTTTGADKDEEELEAEPGAEADGINMMFFDEISLPQWWSFLRRHFVTAQSNAQSFLKTGDTHGFRYSDRQLRQLYSLTSLTGKLMYNVMHRMLGFPCWSVVRGYRQALQQELGLTCTILDGERASLKHLLSLFPFKGSDKRCVLSIDATAVKCNFGVMASGKVVGTVHSMAVPREHASKIVSQPNEFEKFHSEHRGEIAKAAFLVMMNPVAVEEQEIPIAIFPYHQGNMDDVILEKLLTLNTTMKDLGFIVVGNGFDGDPKFTHYALLLCNKMMMHAASDMTATVPKVFSDVLQDAKLIPFFDPNHQVKCDRYRRTLPNDVCAFFNLHPTIHRQDFTTVLKLGKSVMSESELHKMDDNLPRMLFNVPNLLKALEANRIDLFIALFPSTALITAVMDEKISREDRVYLLLGGWSLMFLYYVSMLQYKPVSSDSQTLKKSGDRPISLWHSDHVKRYLSSTACIIHILLDQRSVNLGALGSHHNENYFGRIKRLGHYDESIERFKKSTEKALLMKKLFSELELPFCPTSRNSMSGARVPAGEITELHPIGYYLFLAKSLLELITTYDALNLSNAIEAFRVANKIPQWKTRKDALTLLPNSVLEELKEEMSECNRGKTLRMTRDVNTSGALCKERFISASQVTVHKE